MTIELTKPMAPGFRGTAGSSPRGGDVMCPPGRSVITVRASGEPRFGGCALLADGSFPGRAPELALILAPDRPICALRCVSLCKFPAKGYLRESLACRSGWCGWLDRADCGASSVLRGDGRRRLRCVKSGPGGRIHVGSAVRRGAGGRVGHRGGREAADPASL